MPLPEISFFLNLPHSDFQYNIHQNMRNRFLLLLACLMVITACNTPEGMIVTGHDTFELDVKLNHLAHDMVKSLREENKSNLAIVEFPDLDGRVSQFGKYVAEELTTRLFTTRRFNIIERQLLNQLLAEQNLGQSGLIDVNSAAQIGKMLGVDAIVTGTITDLGNNIRINARLIETVSASVFAVASVTIEKDDQIQTMLNRTQTPLAEAGKKQEQTPEAPSLAEPLSSTISEGYAFEVKSCIMLPDNKVRIEMLVTNQTDRERELYFYRDRTAMFDNFGNEYQPVSRELANKREAFHVIKHLMIAGLPTHMALEFERVKAEATSVPLLNLYLWDQQPGFFTVGIRNIPIEH